MLTMLGSEIRCGTATDVIVLAPPGSTSAKRLIGKYGIEFPGTARGVTFATGACNVLEASYTEVESERINANDGQPLDVWQLDSFIYNWPQNDQST